MGCGESKVEAAYEEEVAAVDVQPKLSVRTRDSCTLHR